MSALTSDRWQRIHGLVVLVATTLNGALVYGQDALEQAVPPPRPLQMLPEQLTAPTETSNTMADIAVGSLAAPDRDQIGLVDEHGGGFLETLWQGSDLETLRKILIQLPTSVTSPAQRDLMRNMLLSAGGIYSAEDIPASSAWLIETRIARLAAMGAWDDALAMIELVPPGEMTEAIRRLRADAYLIAGRIGDACSETQAALRQVPDIYWQKVQIFCHLEKGQASAADLGLLLLREQQPGNTAYFWAVNMLRGNEHEPPISLGKPTPLLLAILRAVGLPALDMLIESGDATTVGILAEIPHLDHENSGEKLTVAEADETLRDLAETRILAAEQAVAVGTLKSERLRELYRDFSIDVKVDLRPEETSAVGVRARVRLFQAALEQTTPMARAEIIARAFDIARADVGGVGSSVSILSLLYLPLLEGISPTADMVWFSGTAARMFLAARKTKAAKQWMALAQNMSRINREAASIAYGLWPLERLLSLGAKGRLPARAMDDWAARASELAAVQGREMFLNLFAAFGDPVEITDWQPVLGASRVMERGPSVAPHVWNGLSLAAQNRRVGEAVVFALIALGDEGPAFAAPETLAKVVETLMAVGREEDARALALEAVLVFGL